MAKSKKPHKTASNQNNNSASPPSDAALNGTVNLESAVTGYATDITDTGIQSKVQRVLQDALPASNRSSGLHQAILESDLETSGRSIQPIAASSPIAQVESSVFKPIEAPSTVTPIEESGTQKSLERWTPPPKKVLPPEPSVTPTELTRDALQSIELAPAAVSADFQFEHAPVQESAIAVFHAPPLHRRTIVQEFDIPKLVKHTREVPVEVEEQKADGLSSAMMYFTGNAEKTTYTSELRFRAMCALERDSELDSSVNAAQDLPPQEEQWNQIDSFAPPQEEPPRILPSSGLSMLDVIDQGYKTLLTGPESFAPPRQIEVEVDYSQPQSRLLPPQTGLSRGLGTSTKGGGSVSKNRWSKK